MKRVGIIGAGAGGMIAALESSGQGAKVTLFERKDRIGKKILATGNGRCNFTNMNLGGEFYYTDNRSFIDNTFSRFGNTDLIRYFYSLGLITKEKNGYCYPQCEQASSVNDVFLYALKERDVEIITDCNVQNITKKDDVFLVETGDNRKLEFDAVIISTGGKSGLSKNETANGYELVKNFGHHVSRLFPCLTQIKCSDFNFKAVTGVRSDCRVSIISDEETVMMQEGEILFTDYGISGIVSFQVSHLVNELLSKRKKVYARLDLLPGMDEETLKSFVISKRLLHSDVSLEDFFTGFVNKKLAVSILKSEGMDLNKPVSFYDTDTCIEAALLFKNLSVLCTGTNDFSNSQVTGGGISLSEITEDFESVYIKDLYIVGELLDVDGICGGYNLQWAFSGGFLAGRAAGRVNGEKQ